MPRSTGCPSWYRYVGTQGPGKAEEAARDRDPRVAVLQCKSGGARMQEGTLSLMQMAKVSAVRPLHLSPDLVLTILTEVEGDPTCMWPS